MTPLQTIDPHGCFVYVLWGDDTETPLYVGQSINVMNRLGAHLSNGQRFARITRIDLYRFDDRAEMMRAERKLIVEHQPPWNKKGTRREDFIDYRPDLEKREGMKLWQGNAA